MTDRIQNLVDAGRLSREPAPDDEIAGLGTNAVQAFHDAQVESLSANGRLLRADLEYGWQAGASPADVQRALDVIRRILRLGAVELAASRPSLSARLPES